MSNLLDDLADDQVEELRLENQQLVEKVTQLEKALTKAKETHRKFNNDVVESEILRIREFENEKKNLKEENKRMIEQCRQVSKDLEFYKTGFEELLQEETNTSTMPIRKSTRPTSVLHSSELIQASTTPTTPSSTPSHNRQQGSKVITMISEKLHKENKKLTMKISKLTNDRKILRAKVKQLENFKSSVNNKKIAHLNHLKELEQLVESSKVTNEETFNATILAQLGELSKCD